MGITTRIPTSNSTNSFEFFNFEEMEKGVGRLMDPIISVWGHLANDAINSNIVQNIDHLFLEEFKKMASLAFLAITRSTNEAHILVEHPPKLNYTLCRLGFILDIKHNNATMFDAFMWN